MKTVKTENTLRPGEEPNAEFHGRLQLLGKNQLTLAVWADILQKIRLGSAKIGHVLEKVCWSSFSSSKHLKLESFFDVQRLLGGPVASVNACHSLRHEQTLLFGS